jgi:polyhydroxyalkanoate synthesis regulator protein
MSFKLSKMSFLAQFVNFYGLKMRSVNFIVFLEAISLAEIDALQR